MTTRRRFIATAAVAAAMPLASIRAALAQPTPQVPGEADGACKSADIA